jgi:hypothetical protein
MLQNQIKIEPCKKAPMFLPRAFPYHSLVAPKGCWQNAVFHREGGAFSHSELAEVRLLTMGGGDWLKALRHAAEPLAGWNACT